MNKVIVRPKDGQTQLQIDGRRIVFKSPIALSEKELGFIDLCRVKTMSKDGDVLSDECMFELEKQ